ncbi:hypothetical protein LSAT2_009641 [Lamellibrachia satsuma]|nr:hypothetical protein LSAT2_009641 [Lamellibrachia satsuma]
MVHTNVRCSLRTNKLQEKYKALKRKLRFLIYEQECFLEELRKSQRKLLRVSRDKSFLLDQLLQYEKVDELSSDSDATASSESEMEGGKEGSSGKKKKAQHAGQMGMFGIAGGLPPNLGYAAMGPSQLAMAASQSLEPPKKKAKVTKKGVGTKLGQLKSSGLTVSRGHLILPPGMESMQAPGHMTREELERHLDMKQSSKSQFMSIESAPYSLPDDIFSNESSNHDSEHHPKVKEEVEETDLVIDMPL